jgi:hypothetical protein
MIILSRNLGWICRVLIRTPSLPSAISRTLSGLPQRARDLRILLDADPEIPVLGRQAWSRAAMRATASVSLLGLRNPSTVALSRQVSVGRANLTPSRIRRWP